MSAHTKTTTTTIEASAKEVWRVLDADFIKVSRWGPGVLSSGPNPATPYGVNGSAYGGRVCQVEGLGRTDERIVGYDGGSRSLRYTVEAEGFPAFIESLENTWTVTPSGSDRSIVETRLDVTIADSLSEQDARAAVDAVFGGLRAAESLRAFIERE